MLTLVQRRKAQMLAAAGAAQVAAAGERTGPAATEYQLQLARLGVDLRQLREIQSIERKIERKREVAPGYFDWIAGVLEADTGAQDEVLVQVMIWTIDIGDFASAMPMIRYVLRHKLTLPERFERTAPTTIAEEVAEAALKALGQDQDFDRAVLMEIDDLVELEDIYDPVRAKLEKAIGLQLERDAAAIPAEADGPAGLANAARAQALARLRRALALDPSCGVKKRADALERTLKREATAPATNPGRPSPTPTGVGGGEAQPAVPAVNAEGEPGTLAAMAGNDATSSGDQA